MREKLIELIIEYFGVGNEHTYTMNSLTDHLIENGVIFPVRCEYCDWYREEGGGICVNPKCGKSYYGCRVSAQHFCAYGEPKESEE